MLRIALSLLLLSEANESLLKATVFLGIECKHSSDEEGRLWTKRTTYLFGFHHVTWTISDHVFFLFFLFFFKDISTFTFLFPLLVYKNSLEYSLVSESCLQTKYNMST